MISKPKSPSAFIQKIPVIIASILFLVSVGLFLYGSDLFKNLGKVTTERNAIQAEFDSLMSKYDMLMNDYNDLKNQDQLKINQELRLEISDLQKGFNKAVLVYEDIIVFRDKGGKSTKLEERLALALKQLSDRKYKDAIAALDKISIDLNAEEAKLASSFSIPANVPVNNAPPSTGYSRQQVSTLIGNYLVSMVAGDLSNTKIIVDTASDGTCANDCPVLPLATYVSRSGAYAGVNGSYFCPATYPQCAGKTNSFDLLLMNKNKVYFNSDNNVYSSNPGVVFGGGYIRFLTSVSQWGRDTGIDGMISNFPMLIYDKKVVFGGDDDPKKGSKGSRSFVANKGSQVFIGVVHNVTVAESAIVLSALGMDNALNLDSGGSTALWSGGYKVGPGRDLPNAVLFIRK